MVALMMMLFSVSVRLPCVCRYEDMKGPPAEALPTQDVGPKLPPGGWRGNSTSGVSKAAVGQDSHLERCMLLLVACWGRLHADLSLHPRPSRT